MFKVKLHRRVIKFLQKLNENDRKRIFSTIEKLEDPFSQPYEKVKGRRDLYKCWVVIGSSIVWIKRTKSSRSILWINEKEFTIVYNSLSSLNNIDLMK